MVEFLSFSYNYPIFITFISNKSFLKMLYLSEKQDNNPHLAPLALHRWCGYSYVSIMIEICCRQYLSKNSTADSDVHP